MARPLCSMQSPCIKIGFTLIRLTAELLKVKKGYSKLLIAPGSSKIDFFVIAELVFS